MEYNSMNNLYEFDLESVDDILHILSEQIRTRRLERGLSREALSAMSGVPTPTIAKFEQKSQISLRQYVALAKALGYKENLKSVAAEPIYHTMSELETINQNKSRKRGRNQFNQPS